MTLRHEETEGVVVLTLDRPPVNALDLDTVLALEDRFNALAESPPAALVLTGEGGAFCAGVDTRAFASASREDRARRVLAISRMVTALYALPMPTVAAVNGHAIGGGFVLALACDARICALDQTIRLGLTEARAGVPFPAGPIEVMKAELAPDLLRRLTLTGAVLSPEELRLAGPIDSLVEAGSLLAAACALGREMASQTAFGLVKAQLRASTIERLRSIVATGDDPLLARIGV